MAGEAGTNTLNAPPPPVGSAYTGAPAGAAAHGHGGAATMAPAGPAGTRPNPLLAHQTVKQRHPLRSVLILLGVLLGAAAIFWLSWRAHTASADAQSSKRAMMANRPVPVVTAAAHVGDMPIFIEGLGAVTPFNVVTIRTRVDGQIMKLSFKEGDIVKEGDPLVDIDPRPYQVQLAQAQAQLAKDQAALASAQANVAMDRSAQNAISQQQLITDTATANQDLAATQIDQTQIDSAKLQLVYCHITSPITGRVGLQLVNLGNFVQSSDSTGICVITELQPIAVEFAVAESNIPRIMGSSATVPPLEVDAYDDANVKHIATGKLMAIDSQIDSSTGTVKLKAWFDNKNLALFPSQFVNAHLLVKTQTNAVLVPTQAVQQGPDSTFVYVVKGASGASGGQHHHAAADGTADTSRTAKPESQDQPAQAEQAKGEAAGSEHASGPAAGGKGGWGHSGDLATVTVQNVTVGASDGLDTVITTGLKPGQVVVTDGVDKLQDGSKVTPRAAPPEKTQAGGSAAAGESANGGASTQPTDEVATTQPAGAHHRRHRPAATQSTADSASVGS